MSWVQLLAWSAKSTCAELSESPSAKQSARALQELSPPSPSAFDFWNWSELEPEHSRAAEFHSELVLVMTTRNNCHLKCLICRLSVIRELVVRLVQVPGVSCVTTWCVRYHVPKFSMYLEQQ